MPENQKIKVRDLKEYARQTNIQLFIGAILVLFIVGDGLIYLIYGPHQAITGLICLVSAFLPIILIIGVLKIIDWIVKRANQ